MKIDVHKINAFSIHGEGGNPAGVVFDADQFSSQEKQEIAATVGLPETAFVSSSAVADFRLEFFTPTKQIPHCGHATIATFSYLKSMGKIAGDHSSKETIDGCRTILFKDGMAFMEQKAPTFQNDFDVDEVLNSLRLSKDDLITGMRPSIINTGNSFLILPVKDATVLSNIQYLRQEVYRLSENYGLIGYYLYAPSANFDATTRMFAPFYGIDEEAGTGMAAGPLAAYLRKVGYINQTLFRIQQGLYMKPLASPSLIYVQLELSGDIINKLYAGGSAYVSATMTITV